MDVDSVDLQNENRVMDDEDTAFQYLDVEYLDGYADDFKINDVTDQVI